MAVPLAAGATISSWRAELSNAEIELSGLHYLLELALLLGEGAGCTTHARRRRFAISGRIWYDLAIKVAVERDSLVRQQARCDGNWGERIVRRLLGQCHE
jgi:hypothetical protein